MRRLQTCRGRRRHPVKPALPFIPGHEGVGRVAAVGAGVRHVKEGDRVGVPWLHTACGHCEHCLTGWETLCDSQTMTGYTVNGGYAEYVLADADYVGRLPAKLDFAAAAPLLCAGVTVYKGLKMLDCKAGDWVAISGIGGLGHMALQYARAMGFHVIGIDVTDDKLALARKLGADVVLNAAKQDVVAEVQRQLGGAHGVLVTAVSRSAFAQGVGLLHKRGTMSLVRLTGRVRAAHLDVVQAKTIHGSIVRFRGPAGGAGAEEGKVRAHYSTDRLGASMASSRDERRIDGRVVLEF
jgi:propanol-preferring alcohol dehydrogenase